MSSWRPGDAPRGRRDYRDGPPPQRYDDRRGRSRSRDRGPPPGRYDDRGPPGPGYRDASAILRCGVLWCDAAADDEASNYATVVALMLLIGGFSAFLLFAGLAFRVARRRSTPSTTLTEPLLDDAEAGPSEPVNTKAPNTIAWTVSLIVVLALLLLLTSILPNSWQGFTSAGLAKYRRTGAGSMVDQWTRAAPEGRKAWFRTAFYQINARLTLKVYPDVILYYAFLAALALVACAGRVSPRVGRLLRRRLRMGSVGECVALGLFALLLVLEGRYAFVDHQYASDPTKGRWEVLARGTGQCANLGLALLLLPVGRSHAGSPIGPTRPRPQSRAAYILATRQISSQPVIFGAMSLAVRVTCLEVLGIPLYSKRPGEDGGSRGDILANRCRA